MQISRLIDAIEERAPLSCAASWDRSGLQVATPRDEISRLAVTLDPTPAAVRAALDKGADFILTHHPLSLSPDLPGRLDAYHEVLSLLFKADAGLYAAHTSLDVQPDGPAGWLARHLCMRGQDFLEKTGEACGFGLWGDLPNPLSLAEILALLAERIDLSDAVAAGPEPGRISRVAYCTGSGASLLHEAEATGADLYITGDIKYHTALETRLCLLDVGHHSLEEEMMREMAALLTRSLDLEVFFLPSGSPFRRVKAD